MPSKWFERFNKPDRFTPNPAGLEKVSTFLTADALLATVALVWAQLWTHPSIDFFIDSYIHNTPQPSQTFDHYAGFGLVLSFFAVFFAISALALAGWMSLYKNTDKTPGLSIGLFSNAVIATAMLVFQSATGVLKKRLDSNNYSSIYLPLKVPSWLALDRVYPKIILGVGLGLVILIIFFGIIRNYRSLFTFSLIALLSFCGLWSIILIII
jgi:hypothetical protein